MPFDTREFAGCYERDLQGRNDCAGPGEQLLLWVAHSLLWNINNIPHSKVSTQFKKLWSSFLRCISNRHNITGAHLGTTNRTHVSFRRTAPFRGTERSLPFAVMLVAGWVFHFPLVVSDCSQGVRRLGSCDSHVNSTINTFCPQSTSGGKGRRWAARVNLEILQLA